MRRLLAVLAVLLSGCAGTGGPPPASVERPVSEQSAVGDAQQRAKVHTELGTLYLREGRAGVALEEAKVALESDSGYAPAYNLLGLVYGYLRETTLAEENFQQALRLAPGDPEINNNYGWFVCQMGRERESLAYFQSAIRNPLYETPTRPLTNAGVCMLRVKDDVAAEDFFRRALQADRTNPQAHYWMADILYRTNRLRDARAYIGGLHNLIEPTSQSLWLALRVERKLGDRDGEARYGSQLRRKFQGTPEHQKLQQGQYE